MKVRNPFGIILLILLLTGCSLDYREAILEEELAENIPEMVLVNFRHVVVKNGVKAAMVEAERAEDYSKKHEIMIRDVHFIEYSMDGSIVNEGWADRALYNEDTGDAVIEGDIFVKSNKQKGNIIAEKLYWKDKERELKGDPEEEVVMKKEDGSFVRGRGFIADFNTKSFRFLKDVSGRYEGKSNE